MEARSDRRGGPALRQPLGHQRRARGPGERGDRLRVRAGWPGQPDAALAAARAGPAPPPPVPALKRGGLVCACALLVAGCTSFVRLDSPRTVPPGHREVMVGLSGYTDDRKDSNLFNTDLLLRWGLTDRTDVGLRFNLVGVATDLKWQ